MVPKKYEDVIKIRAFEKLILDLFGKNKLSGTTHTYIGEEATAAAIMEHITDDDFIFSNHRCHGHYLAYGGPVEGLLAEIMSKESGLCNGKGGSQHIHYKNFFTNGIQGGIVPNATGIAFANKLKGNKSNTVVFIGDGTLGQGVVYESLNIASVNSIPILYVIEDNAYAMSTKRTDVIAGDIKSRIEGFDITTFEISSTDVDELDSFFKNVFSFLNATGKPACAIVHNYRLGAHSKGDDTRNPDEIAEHKKNDPIAILESLIGKEAVDELYSSYRNKFEALAEKIENEESIQVTPPNNNNLSLRESVVSHDEVKFVEAIRNAFEQALQSNPGIVMMGEDICDPYGGAFKTTKGLSLSYDKQIFNMPISEACMVGLCVGMAMNGLLPVVEMMFGDFITLGFDQLLNHASKYGWIYDVNVPMIVRVPSGAKRGYGPTHSQSLEKFLIGIPGIRVMAMSEAFDPQKMYQLLFGNINEPTVVIENKKMYGQKTWNLSTSKYKCFDVTEEHACGSSTLKFTLDKETEPDFYAITYGGMAESTLEAAEALMMEDEIQVDVIVLSQLSPMPIGDIEKMIGKKAPAFVIEEGTKTSGIGAEIIAACVEAGIGKQFRRIATPDMPIPNGIVLEAQVVPTKETIIHTIKSFI